MCFYASFICAYCLVDSIICFGLGLLLFANDSYFGLDIKSHLRYLCYLVYMRMWTMIVVGVNTIVHFKVKKSIVGD
jgi:hypothetical protein